MRRRVVLSAFLIVLVAMGAGTSWAQTKKVRRAPNFSLPDWQHHWVKLSDYAGKVVVLEFMQTRCPYCHATAQILEELYQKYKDEGLMVISVSHDPNKEKDIKLIVEQYGLTYPILVGDLGIAIRYIGITPEHNTFTIPYIFVIDRQGNIAGEFVYDRDLEFFADEKNNLEKEIVPLLKQPARQSADTSPRK